ncbi:hypothetical protein CEE37_13665 [candidate division LCP-89 bacterium B3_LCP]|uniref:Outer membrane protein beta-barrel domain-containing protein n=1 Tax=candidate division LCP-89 bacterium B3_LCP TaxID=2012998 RepID=A0A532URK2_UNCL8|nr:MAG: hypothetical protein CEE37_13665 [candidate division LCP-89 bacterium B3_LCP]
MKSLLLYVLGFMLICSVHGASAQTTHSEDDSTEFQEQEGDWVPYRAIHPKATSGVYLSRNTWAILSLGTGYFIPEKGQPAGDYSRGMTYHAFAAGFKNNGWGTGAGFYSFEKENSQGVSRYLSLWELYLNRLYSPPKLSTEFFRSFLGVGVDIYVGGVFAFGCSGEGGIAMKIYKRFGLILRSRYSFDLFNSNSEIEGLHLISGITFGL